MHILIVDHSSAGAHDLQVTLQQHGYAVDVATTTAAGDETAVVDHHDLILLVDARPGLDGARLCRDLRRQKVGAPILMLSTPGSSAAKVAGLDAGADDCLASPFQMDELLARVRSLLRRAQPSEGAILRSGDLVMNLYERRITIAGNRVKLSAKEFTLLEYMLRNPRRLLTRTMISESVWDMNYESGSNVIDVYVSSLRRKIDTDATHRRIETVIGSGYRFRDAGEAAEVEVLTEANRY